MKKIGTYIYELLYWHDCVIIPGLGGFVANQRSAEIEEEKGLFLPPKKEIGFNRSLSHNDGLLINFIAQNEGIGYVDAGLLVRQYVDDIQQQINSSTSFEISGVGFLKSDAIGNLLFQPSGTSGFMPGSFGLSSFYFDVESNHDVVESPKEHIRRVMKPVSISQVAASVAVLMGLFFFTPEMNINSAQKSLNQAGYLTVLIPQSIHETQIIPVEEEVTHQEVVVEAVVPEPQSRKVEEPLAAEKNYYLIAGSFPNHQLADTFLKQLEKKGITGAVKLDCQGKVRVALEGYADKASAIEKMKIYKQKQNFESVWVYAHKN